MSKKIFKAIWLVAVTVFAASLFFIMGVLYSYFTQMQYKQLKAEADLAAQGIAQSGIDFFDHLVTEHDRITWIAADGTVLFDSNADTSSMENHLQREEVKEALSKGYGYSSRYSKTLTEKYLYTAKLLPDGSIIRLASQQNTTLRLILGFAQPICIVLAIAVIISFILASRLTKKIIQPINAIDLEHPQTQEIYEELTPLLSRITYQQEQLRHDKEELDKTEQIRREFTANVSHELKTPLHVISGYSELMKNNMVPAESTAQFAGLIYTEAQRMTTLVEDIINLSHLDEGCSEMQFEDTDLYRIAENALDSLRYTAEQAGVSLCLSGNPAPMYGIPSLLYTIVYNLCDNAIKYNKPEGSVSISIDTSENSIQLKVTDTGIGIPDDCTDRVFERFYRVDKSHSKKVGGTGLGLSIVKHAVAVHRGVVHVESVLNEGTTICIKLPRNVENK